MQRKEIVVALVFALALGAGAARAEEPPRHDPKAAFAETDRDGDGYVDREEFHQRLAELFFFVDRDKDGFVEPEELDEATLVRQDLSVTDRNGDGRISLHEFVEARFALYRASDTDSDGRLSLDEVVRAYEQAQGAG